MDIYIKVGESEVDSEPIELPVEKDDNTMLLSSVGAQFPGACGLKYRNQETQTMRGLKLVDGSLFLPSQNDDWKTALYIVVYPKDNKRKMEDEDSNSVRSKRFALKCTDLIVLGLPWKITESDLRDYFSSFGELRVAMIKHDHTGKSKGYGFIKYSSYEVQQTVLKQRHQIEGRWCDVKIPHSKEESNASPKIFVGRINESMTKDDIKSHFEQYGEVDDVYIPTPFRSFAFVTFCDATIAQSLIGEDQVIKGVSVSINSANPKSSNRGNTYSAAAPSMYNNVLRSSVDPHFHHHRQSGYQTSVTGAATSYVPAEPHNTPANMDPSMLSPAMIAAAIGSWSHMMNGMLAGQNTMVPPQQALDQRGPNNGGNNPQTGRGDSNVAWRPPQPEQNPGAPGNWSMK